MKVTGEGFKNAAIGISILAGLGVLFIFGNKIVNLVTGISNTAGDASNAIAGALVPDANAKIQSTVQQAEAALKAAGNPQPGTQAYNDVVEQFGIAGAPITGSVPAASISQGS